MARLRFELRPRSELRLPVEVRGNALRGALGMNLRRAVCDPGCDDASRCTRREECPYARLFEPVSQKGASFGAQDPPRPFVFRPPLDPDPDFGPHRPLIFELRLFGSAISEIPHFVLPLLDLAKTGLAGRKVELLSVLSLDWMGRTCGVLVDDGRINDVSPLALDFDWVLQVPSDGPRARLEFLTPTLLPMRQRSGSHDSEGQVPSMAALVRRVRDRLSLLCLIWEDREWVADYGALGDLADRVSTTSHEGRAMTFLRQSTKTGQTLHMSGFCGTATYDGIHPDLWPLLRMGQEIHAGRFTEWGLGLCRIRP